MKTSRRTRFESSGAMGPRASSARSPLRPRIPISTRCCSQRASSSGRPGRCEAAPVSATARPATAGRFSSSTGARATGSGSSALGALRCTQSSSATPSAASGPATSASPCTSARASMSMIAGRCSMSSKNSFHNALRRRGAMGGAGQGRREPSYACHMGATEDAASRRPARPGGSRLIVKRVLSRWRIAAFVADAAVLALYFTLHESLPEVSLWWDVAIIATLVIPAVFATVGLLLPLRNMPWRWAVTAALIGLAIGFSFLGWEAPASFAKLGAATFIGWMFLDFFEVASWVVIVALIIPWVDAYSVWRGRTNTIVHHHKGVFEHLSFAFPVPGEDNTANLGKI